jgi:hypothetical protein
VEEGRDEDAAEVVMRDEDVDEDGTMDWMASVKLAVLNVSSSCFSESESPSSAAQMKAWS